MNQVYLTNVILIQLMGRADGAVGSHIGMLRMDSEI